MKYVRCIKEWHSIIFPKLCFGRLGSVYRVEQPDPRHYNVLDFDHGWTLVMADRFEDVTVEKTR